MGNLGWVYVNKACYFFSSLPKPNFCSDSSLIGHLWPKFIMSIPHKYILYKKSIKVTCFGNFLASISMRPSAHELKFVSFSPVNLSVSMLLVQPKELRRGRRDFPFPSSWWASQKADWTLLPTLRLLQLKESRTSDTGLKKVIFLIMSPSQISSHRVLMKGNWWEFFFSLNLD